MTDDVKILFFSQKELPARALAGEITAFEIAGEVVHTDDFDDFRELSATGGFAAFVLDEPDETQRAFALKNARNAAVVFLSSALIEKSEATVIVKPFRLSAALSALIGAVGRFRQNGGATVPLGKALFDTHAKTVTKDGQKIALTDKEAELLSCLARRKNAADKETLLKQVWGFADGVDTHTLETHLYRLRQKLEPVGVHILSETDTGYKLEF